jgi:hypothetical protein
MNLARSRSAIRYGRPASILALVALLLRSVIAPGSMLDPAAMAQGGLKLIICTASGTKSVAVAPGKEQSPGPSANGDICPCAAPAAAGELSDPVILASQSPRPIFHPWRPDRAAASARPLAFAARAPPGTA